MIVATTVVVGDVEAWTLLLPSLAPPLLVSLGALLAPSLWRRGLCGGHRGWGGGWLCLGW